MNFHFALKIMTIVSDGGEWKDLQKSPGSNETISMQAISQSKYRDMMQPTSPPHLQAFSLPLKYGGWWVVRQIGLFGF